MVRRLLLAVVLALAASGADAQPRPPSGIGNAPSQAGPPPPRGLFFFFDLFAPRQPAAPPPAEPQRNAPGGPSGSSDARGSGSAKPAPPPVVVPYEGDLVRIAEIMGALHYLRPLCGAPEGNRWRSEMQALIEAEAATEDRKDKLIRGFNRGYTAFERTYRVCTPAADLAVARYLEEGAKLTRDLVARYGN